MRTVVWALVGLLGLASAPVGLVYRAAWPVFVAGGVMVEVAFLAAVFLPRVKPVE